LSETYHLYDIQVIFKMTSHLNPEELIVLMCI